MKLINTLYFHLIFCSGASNLDELQSILRDKVMIRRLKKDVLTQLPPKQRQRIPFEIKESTLKKDLDSKWETLNKALGRNGTSVSKVIDLDMYKCSCSLNSSSFINSRLPDFNITRISFTNEKCYL